MGRIIKAISLWEPWASLIAEGHKTVETRSWPINHEGELLICASKNGLSKKEKASFIASFHGKPEYKILMELKENPGMAVAIVEVTGCASMDYFKALNKDLYKDQEAWGDFLNGRFAWIFEDIRKIQTPFPVKGMQGFFNVQLPDQINLEWAIKKR